MEHAGVKSIDGRRDKGFLVFIFAPVLMSLSFWVNAF